MSVGDKRLNVANRERTLDQLESFGKWLDSLIRVPGTNFRIVHQQHAVTTDDRILDGRSRRSRALARS